MRVKKVFECGIGSIDPSHHSSMAGSAARPGASLRAWRDYFPNADIYGADIDEKALFSEERIITGCIDQTRPEAIQAFFCSLSIKEFDIMIDDGWHIFKAGKCLFENSSPLLSPGGIYVIEDVSPRDIPKYYDFFLNTEGFEAEIVLMNRDDQPDNNMVIARRRA